MGLIIFLLGKRGQNIENLRKIRISVKKKTKRKKNQWRHAVNQQTLKSQGSDEITILG